MAKMRDWTLALPAYAPDAPCPKCGHATVSTRYCIGARPDRAGEPCARLGYGKAEHLDRACCRCEYEWAEQVIAPVQAYHDSLLEPPALEPTGDGQ